MDVIFSNTPIEEEPEDDIMVGDNALSIDMGASFLMGEDPKKDPVKKPLSKASIGDAPMGEKPTEDPLTSLRLSFSSRANRSAGDDDEGTTIAKASSVGLNPLGLNPLGLDEAELERLGIKLQPAPAKKSETAPVSAKEPATAAVKAPATAPSKEPAVATAKAAAPVAEKVTAPEQMKAEEPKVVSLSNIISLSDPSIKGGMIFSIYTSFESEEAPVEAAPEKEEKVVAVIPEEVTLEAPAKINDDDDDMSIPMPQDDDVKPLGKNDDDDDFGLLGGIEDEHKDLGGKVDEDGSGSTFMGLDSSENDPMDLLFGVDGFDDEPIGLGDNSTVSEKEKTKESSSEKKAQDKGADEVDPLRALLMAGGNPFGENAKIIAPDLSFGKDALKPKHFEPMKASGPRVNAENVRENNPLGNNPFGKDVEPDFSFGKEALKPKKYEPKKPYEDK